MTERTTPGLEPCPYCGDEAELFDEHGSAQVTCSVIGCNASSCECLSGPEAIDAWNAVSRAVQSQRALDDLPKVESVRAARRRLGWPDLSPEEQEANLAHNLGIEPTLGDVEE